MTIYDFVDCHSLELRIQRIPNRTSPWIKDTPWMADIPMSETKDYPTEPFLRTCTGWGKDPESAVLNFAKRLSGKILVFSLCRPDNERKTIQVPVFDGVSA